MTNRDLPEHPRDLRTLELTPREKKLLLEYGYDFLNQPTNWDKDDPTKSMYFGMDSRRRGGLAYTYDCNSLTDSFAYDVLGRRTSAMVGGATNIYAYVEGNPVSETDPLGLAPPRQGSQGGYQFPCYF